MAADKNYKDKLSQHLDEQHVELYWKGRVGLYALLKSFEVGPGDEVIMPAFTCVVVPSAVLYLGATPVYVDIEQGTFSPSFKSISSAVTSNTKVIICQNTFGLSFELEEIVAFAKECGVYTIEDCTHGFGGRYNGKANGSFCDAAIYSTQWNKPFSTGIGGFISVRDTELLKKIRMVSDSAIKPGLWEQLQLFCLYFLKQALVNRYTYWGILKSYRWLSKRGIVIGSSSPKELKGVDQPENYFRKSGAVQAFLGMRALQKLESCLVRRKSNGEIYTETLRRLGKNHVGSQYFFNHSFLVYPVLVHDKVVFRELAENNRIILGDWFASPLHPVTESLEIWGLNINEYPVARYCSEHIVNLPTNISNISVVVQFLEDYSVQLIDA